MRYENRGIIVTGATRGLGLELVRGLVNRGARIVGVARHINASTPLTKLAEDHDSVWTFAADVGDPDAAARIVGYANAVLGPVDALFNNASTLGPLPMSELNDTTDEDWLEVLQTNLIGPTRLIRASMPSFVRKGQGLIVNISSDAACHAYPTWGLYGTSKAALDHATAIWARETEPAGVIMTAVDPGEMNTQMHADAIPDASPDELNDPRDVAEAILNRLEQADVPTRWKVSR